MQWLRNGDSILHDPFMVERLRELIKQKLIAPGVVDDRKKEKLEELLTNAKN